jgi:hypothetical protein
LAIVSRRLEGLLGLELEGAFGLPASTEVKVGGSLAFASGRKGGSPALEVTGAFSLPKSTEGNVSGSLAFVSGRGGGSPALELVGFGFAKAEEVKVGGSLAFVSGSGGGPPALEPDSGFGFGVSEEGNAGESCALFPSSEIAGRLGPSPRLLGRGRLGSSLSSAPIGLSLFFRCCAINPSYEAVRTRLFVPRSTRLADGLKGFPREQDLTQGRA